MHFLISYEMKLMNKFYNRFYIDLRRENVTSYISSTNFSILKIKITCVITFHILKIIFLQVTY
jgi:hypothetical protein